MTVQSTWSFGTQNAKRMSANEVARSFVVPPTFKELVNKDHCFVIGPRGSGKTTLLKMLTGEGLMAWTSPPSRRIRAQVDFSSVFVPADELWASQVTEAAARRAFTAQALYALVETMIYRLSAVDLFGNPTLHATSLEPEDEAALVGELSDAWRVNPVGNSLLSLQSALDLSLTRLSEPESRALDEDPLVLVSLGAKAFNRRARQPGHRWAILMDEMELAPASVHRSILSFARGGSEVLILKLSMSPFDRYSQLFTGAPAPMAGNDFRTINLADQSRADLRAFTVGLWKQALRASDFEDAPISDVLGSSAIERQPGSTRITLHRHRDVLKQASEADPELRRWLIRRRVNLDALEDLSYVQRSATVRKIYPLVVFRDAVLSFEDGEPHQRSRKKYLEPFTGAEAVITALEGNPRWIKTAFAQMLTNYDPLEKSGSSQLRV